MQSCCVGYAAPCVSAIIEEAHTDAVDIVLPKMDRMFNVVVISHVFKHLLNPAEILKLLRYRLAPDGVRYFEVPNIPSDSLLRYTDHMCETAGPEHRYISGWRFNTPSLRWLARELIPKAVV